MWILRSLLPRPANLCMKAALGDNCFIVTHPARTLLDLQTTLSRSRNSIRSEILACWNWLKLLDFSGNSLICTSRVFFFLRRKLFSLFFFLRVFEGSVNSKVLIKNYRHPGIFWFIGDCSTQMRLLWWIARFIKVALARQPQKHFCDCNFSYSSEEENNI